MSVLIVDYGLSNLGSIRRSLEECGAAVRVSNDPEMLHGASRVVLPGVGSFMNGMENLRRGGWVEALRETTVAAGIPLLGICLGMQLLADRGHEGGDVPGLGLLPGEVRRLEPRSHAERIPHVGWNEIYPAGKSPLFHGVLAGSDFYFVHSFHFIPKNDDHVIATTPYCGGFASAVGAGNIFGVQFHPEKSGRVGFHVLSNFLDQ